MPFCAFRTAERNGHKNERDEVLELAFRQYSLLCTGAVADGVTPLSNEGFESGAVALLWVYFLFLYPRRAAGNGEGRVGSGRLQNDTDQPAAPFIDDLFNRFLQLHARVGRHAV